MKSWLKGWEVLRDVGLTGFGAWIIWRQLYSASVSVPLIILGGALMVPAARANIAALLPVLLGGTGESPPSSSPSSPPPGLPPPGHSSPQEGTGE